MRWAVYREERGRKIKVILEITKEGGYPRKIFCVLRCQLQF